MAQAEAEGGVASLNHPVLGSLSWCIPMDHRPKLVELWHCSWDRISGTALQFWASVENAVPVGGSDFHRLGDIDATGADLLPGAPTTWVEVPADGPGSTLSPASITEGVRAGAVGISASPTGPVVVRRGEELVVMGGDGATLLLVDDPSQPPFDGRRLHVEGERAKLRTGPGTAFLTAKGVVLALCP